MSSFLGWNTAASATTKKEHGSPKEHDTLLNIAVEASGIDAPEQASLQTNNESTNVDGLAVDVDVDSNHSDYVLDSDHTESPHSPSSDQPERDALSGIIAEDAAASCILRRAGVSLTKVSSTGNLRVYHKTDLKNKISAVEHRLLFLEKRLQQLEKKSTIIKSSDSSIPMAIKFVGGCLVLLYIGRIF